MEKNLSGARIIAAGALLALGGVIFLFLARLPEPGEEVGIPTQKEANTVEENRAPFPSLKAVDEAQIDTALVGYRKPNDSAILLEVKEFRAQDWRVGDEFSVVIPQTGYVLETRIEEVLELAPGVTTIKSYPDETMANHVLLTMSRKNTFMSLFTPEGEYELVGGQEYGWLVPSRTLGGPTADDAIVVNEAPIFVEPQAQIEPIPVDG